jgi:o-succinylbenzoate---CoA ligase
MIPAPLAGLMRWPASAPALAWPGGTLDYGELRARVDTLAGHAAALGAPDSPLAILSASRVNIALGVLAALRLGRPALPLDPARPDLGACLAACAPGGALGKEAFGAPGVPAMQPRSGTTASADAERPGDGTALLVATSGTAGTSRVAMLSAAALDAHVRASAAALPALASGDRWLVCLPMGTIGALAALWRTLAGGACLALLERFDPGDARRFMAEGASHVSIVPAMLGPLAEAVAPPPRGLRCLLSGGGPLSAQTAGLALGRGWPLWNAWGMTESASHIAAGPVDREWRAGIVGKPVPGAELTITAAGRVVVAGPMLMSGYASHGSTPGEGLDADGRFTSSDLGELLPDGRLRLFGRADDIIVTGGVNIHPQAVEEIFAGCAGAGDVAVTGRPDARWGQVLVALYTGAASPTTVDAWARSRLPSSTRPREYLKVAVLPRNAMGKLLRAELGQLAAQVRAAEGHQGEDATP